MIGPARGAPGDRSGCLPSAGICIATHHVGTGLPLDTAGTSHRAHRARNPSGRGSSWPLREVGWRKGIGDLRWPSNPLPNAGALPGAPGSQYGRNNDIKSIPCRAMVGVCKLAVRASCRETRPIPRAAGKDACATSNLTRHTPWWPSGCRPGARRGARESLRLSVHQRETLH